MDRINDKYIRLVFDREKNTFHFTINGVWEVKVIDHSTLNDLICKYAGVPDIPYQSSEATKVLGPYNSMHQIDVLMLTMTYLIPNNNDFKWKCRANGFGLDMDFAITEVRSREFLDIQIRDIVDTVVSAMAIDKLTHGSSSLFML